MIKLGINSVLFKGYDFRTAAKYIKAAGYDGVEISGILGMCEHLAPTRWKEDKAKLIADTYLIVVTRVLECERNDTCVNKVCTVDSCKALCNDRTNTQIQRNQRRVLA